MDWGFWAAIVLGLGVGGHAVVGIVLATPLAAPTRRLWQRFGRRDELLALNGSLLVAASALHLAASYAKVHEEVGAVFWSSVAPFPAFMVAGLLELRTIGGSHHAAMAIGFVAFGWHGAVS